MAALASSISATVLPWTSVGNAASRFTMRVYLLAFQILLGSARKSFQCCRFCFSICRKYPWRVARKVRRASDVSAPLRRSVVIQFQEEESAFRWRERSAVHHRFAYGDGLALGTFACTTSVTTSMNFSAVLLRLAGVGA